MGKVRSALGPLGRTFATLAGILGIPPAGRHRNYLDHGPIGAAELKQRGADGLVVMFAELHPAPAPEGVDPTRWQLLLDADDD